MRRATVTFVAATLVSLAALAARAAGPAAAAPGITAVEIESLDTPTYVQRPPGEPDLLMVTEKAGEIEVLENEAVLPRHFIDISHIVSANDERGLLSIAFHPDYRQNRRFYVYYTDNQGDIRVDEFKRRKGSATRASPASRRRVIEVDHPQSTAHHNGATLAFGKSGHLWLATGDGGADNDTARDKTDLLGKVLRIRAFKPNKPNKPGYKVPTQNPFVGEPGRDEIWGYGFRNPFRFSFDYATRTIAIGDVGGLVEEEVSLVEIQPNRGGNYGWPRFEGTFEHLGETPGADPHKPPMHRYDHGLGSAAVTGGHIVRDPELPSLAGRYLFADFYDGDLIAFTPDLANNEAYGVAPTGVNVSSPAAIVSANGGAAGQAYVVSLAGPIYRLEPASP